jgi:hypothetical protein
VIECSVHSGMSVIGCCLEFVMTRNVLVCVEFSFCHYSYYSVVLVISCYSCYRRSSLLLVSKSNSLSSRGCGQTVGRVTNYNSNY